MNPLAALLDPLAFDFMRNGLTVGLLLAVAAGVAGPLVVLRRLTFFGHAIAHTLFPGIVLATAAGAAPQLGGLVAAVLTVALVAGLVRQARVRDDSAIGLVFIGLFALGVLLVGLLRVRSAGVSEALTGNILGVAVADLVWSGALLAIVLGLYVLLARPLTLTAFDRAGAATLGLPVNGLDLIVLTLVAITALVVSRVVGVVLTVALLVTPAAAARCWTGRLRPMMALTALFAALATAVGLYLAFYLPVSPAALIVLLLSAVFGVSVAARRERV